MNLLKNEDNFIDLYATVDTKRHFNINKKSIIIPIDSFINKANEVRDKNIVDIFDKMIETFNPIEYNYILKSHPRIDESEYDQRIHELFANYYDNITILKPKYPIEQLILFDWYNHSKSTVNSYKLVDPLSYFSDMPSALFGGWSLCTTSIISTLNLIANYQIHEHSIIGNKNALKLINTNCIFIPNNFNLTNGDTGRNMYAVNFATISNIYKQFCILGKFIDLNLLNKI